MGLYVILKLIIINFIKYYIDINKFAKFITVPKFNQSCKIPI